VKQTSAAPPISKIPRQLIEGSKKKGKENRHFKTHCQSREPNSKKKIGEGTTRNRLTHKEKRKGGTKKYVGLNKKEKDKEWEWD